VKKPFIYAFGIKAIKHTNELILEKTLQVCNLWWDTFTHRLLKQHMRIYIRKKAYNCLTC